MDENSFTQAGDIVAGESDNKTGLNLVSQPDNLSEPGVADGKFAGKSVEEVKKSYEELEKRFGKQSNELGELRNIVVSRTSSLQEAGVSGRRNEMDGVTGSEQFCQWVKTNVPRELAMMSDSMEAEGDSSVLGLLVNAYKNSSTGNSKDNEKLSAAKMAAPVPGIAGNTSNSTTFTKTQLAKMSSSEYAMLNDEIVRAYAEGRVK